MRLNDTLDTLLLDAGGVLLDESEMEQALAELFVEILSARDPHYSIDDYWQDIQEAVRCFVPSVRCYVLWKRSAFNREYYDHLLSEFRRGWKSCRPPLHLMPGIDQVLRELAGDYHIVPAGQYGKELVNLLRDVDLLKYFGATCTQDDFSITKPDPRYYEQILLRCGRTPERSIMIGDRIDKDVIPAKAVGMKTIRVKVGIHALQQARVPDELPDAEILTVTEIPAAIRRL